MGQAPHASPSPIKEFRTPLPGVVESVSVGGGDLVVTGDDVCVLQAAGERRVLRADWTGVVGGVHVGPGQQVRAGDLILELK